MNSIKGGSASVNDDSMILKAPTEASLDRSNTFQSKLVGGLRKSKNKGKSNKKRTQRRKKTMKRR